MKVQAAGLTLAIPAGLYRPDRDSELMLDWIRAQLLEGLMALDAATGPGVLALALAGQRAIVSAVDVSPLAVRVCRANARRNGLAVDVRRGDLGAPFAGRRFDLVVANPPCSPVRTRVRPTARNLSWYGGPDGRAVLDRLIDAAPRLLAERGRLVIVQSDLAGVDPSLARMRRAGLEPRIERRDRRAGLRAVTRHLVERQLIIPAPAGEEIVVISARAG